MTASQSSDVDTPLKARLKMNLYEVEYCPGAAIGSGSIDWVSLCIRHIRCFGLFGEFGISVIITESLL